MLKKPLVNSLSPSETPTASILVIVRNGESFIREKINNCLDLLADNRNLEILIASDGSQDRTAAIVTSFGSPDIRFFEYKGHTGKIAIINDILPCASGDVVVFSDASAIIPATSLARLLSRFKDPEVGGISGKKQLVYDDSIGTQKAQNSFVVYEDFIRHHESRVSSVASNEGFLFGVRKHLVRSIPKGVTEDLYIAMSVVKQKHKFLFDSAVTAFVPVRAKKNRDEILRRRRIVCQSLSGLWLMRSLLNPFQYGNYSWILFSHKILRRMLPFLMAFLLLSNVFLLGGHWFFAFFFLLQVLAYGISLLLHFTGSRFEEKKNWLVKLIFHWYYFCLGNFGVILGIWDLVQGKTYEKWEPVSEETTESTEK
ncbi:MAG: glycosyltransferase [Thermodesulfobacteriota bacterium]|nr:glycosyltransferase [Thermodesulfobacteriota bacterium]